MKYALLTATALTLAAAPVAAQTTSQVSNATRCTTAAPNFAASAGGFGVIDGQIYSPGGTPFMPRGINVRSNEIGDILNGKVTGLFPGLNFVRINVEALDTPASLAPAVDYLTSRGIVVELEDHPDAGGGQDPWSNEPGDVSWYGQAAGYFKSNPYVWFGTFNEPATTNLSAWQKATYDAIRSAGNNNPILLEANGWAENGKPVMLGGYDTSVYSGMTNVAWDAHYYGWLTGYSTDQQTNNSFLAGMVSQLRQVQSADGTMPVIVAEYGDSTNGSTPDANGMQVVQSVIGSGLGSAAWSWIDAGSDALRNHDGSLSQYGQLVANFIKGSGAAGCAESPIAAMDLTQTTPIAETAVTAQVAGTSESARTSPVISASTGALTPGGGSVTDSQGNIWTISQSGSIRMGDTWVPGGGGTAELVIINGVVFGRDDGRGPTNAGGWFTLSAKGQYWTPSTPPPAAPGAATTPAGTVQPVTAPPLAPASTVQTAPSLSPASTAQTAPPLARNSLSVAEVAALAAGQ